MKKILLVLFLALSGIVASYAQTSREHNRQNSVITNSFWSNWYVQIGLDMSLQNPYGYDFSKVFPKGKTFGLDVAAGKWFSPEIGLRMRVNWENGFPLFKNDHLEWVAPFGRNNTNMDDGGYIAVYGDVHLSLSNIISGYDESRKWNIIVFPRAGIVSNLSVGNNSPMVGAGFGCTYRLKKKLSFYGDMAYQVTTSNFTGGGSTTGMSVSSGCNGFFDFHIGVQFDLGKEGVNKFEKYRTVTTIY